ncbi:MAG: carbon starvation CstA family protein [Planctomycetota bacterium]|jgi:carbon starvation protein
MTPALAALAAFLLYGLGYRFYAGWLSRRVFRLDPAAVTPAHALRDEVDYVPTRPPVLFGHHFASITGLAPMLGPAVAVIWGWLPALLWVVFGAILVGCVHDFSALVISARHRGMSVGHIARDVIHGRAGVLFLLIIFFGVSLAMGVFVWVIARMFSLEIVPGHEGYPQAVLPSTLLMVVAVAAGVLLYRKGWPLLPVAAVGFLLELGGIWLGLQLPTMGLPASAWPGPTGWTWILLGYALLASVLPVWTLLQSRDFLNSLLLYLGMGLAYVGLFVANPEFAAPAVRLDPPGAPGLLPFVFIIIACGAASGFHGLVSSGTTAKQLDKETHARPIGYGGMLGESLLGLLATLACTAGLGSLEWAHTYRDWASVQQITMKIDTFIQGTTSFLSALAVPADLGAALIAMVVVSFALTTLDSATRLLRFNIEELGGRFRLPFTGNRYVASALACGAIAFFAFYEIEAVVDGQTVSKPAALALWKLFGTTNQLLAGLTLVLVTLWLRRAGRATWPTGVPAVFMLGSTITAMAGNLAGFAPGGAQADTPLFVVGGVLFLMALWLLVEAALALRRPLDPPARDAPTH